MLNLFGIISQIPNTLFIFFNLFFSFLSVYVQIYWLFPMSSPFFSLIYPVSFWFLLCFSHLKLAFGSAFMSSIILLKLSILPFISRIFGISFGNTFKIPTLKFFSVNFYICSISGLASVDCHFSCVILRFYFSLLSYFKILSWTYLILWDFLLLLSIKNIDCIILFFFYFNSYWSYRFRL